MAGSKSEEVWVNEETLPSASDKLLKKSMETPFVPVGIAGTLAVLGYGIYAYRYRGPMSTSRYLMRLRVLSQGAIVCSMIIGAALTSWNTKREHKRAHK